ncbi:unnamed protein product [Dracunculus medinensis]|uniref:ShTK domain protein n=1 Tax=Dracunculus medinensis TaxID=318479 RepID=A0A0N4U191_DRAME|nr:unnamed protein product [Dracunculus medinensis]
MNILACTTNVCLTGFTCLTVDNAGRECTCVNIATNCIQLAYLCNDRLYSSLMTQRCPQTCNRCNASAEMLSALIKISATLPCVDLARPNAVSDCPANKNLCQNSLYINVMREQCRKTCGLC